MYIVKVLIYGLFVLYTKHDITIPKCLPNFALNWLNYIKYISKYEMLWSGIKD